jgi:hypothetical protein
VQIHRVHLDAYLEDVATQIGLFPGHPHELRVEVTP